MTEDTNRSAERYTPPEESGLDSSRHTKFAIQPEDVTYTIREGVTYRNTPEGLVKVEGEKT